MKFTYAYKTSDGVRHEAAMDAESREAVFAALRQQGIKAIKVVAADGSKANGEIRGIRKRVLAASVVGACIGTAILTVVIRSTPTPSTYTSGSDGLEARQIRAMVEGMKDEARRFVKAGGSIAQYGRLLVQRQEEEIAYYNRAKAEIEAAQKAKMPAAQLNDLWERRNESLRQMGVKIVPMPE